MSDRTESVRPRPEDIAPVGVVEDAYREFARLRDRKHELYRLAGEAFEAHQSAEAAASGSVEPYENGRRALTRAILAASPREMPTPDEWYDGHAPICMHRSGARTFILVPSGEADSPDDRDKLAARLQVVVLDGEEVAS